jgi:predicted TIM-barrel fold metal-dependent hydrolase
MGVIVNFHSGATPINNFFGDAFPEDDGVDRPGAMGIFVSEVVWWTWRPITFLIWGGVFEKFPGLKVVVSETGTAWMLPPWLRLLDHHYTDTQFSQKLGDFRSHLSKKPSEYFRENVGIGASCMPRHDADIRHEIGLKQIMWGSDYPHPEGTWPQTASMMLDTFKGLPEDEVADMLGNNAIEFYGLDKDKLAGIAGEIGPLKSDFA